jgi:AbrB family looped-hinge helix DNA binding protein
MTSVVRIREKGQVTLPLEVRRQLGLREGDLLEAAVKDGRIVLELVVRRGDAPVSVPVQHLGALMGIVSLGGDAVADAARYDE